MVCGYSNKKEFDYHFMNTSLFIESYYDDISRFNNLLKLTYENKTVCCYCGELFLLPYMDEQLLESHYIGSESYEVSHIKKNCSVILKHLKKLNSNYIVNYLLLQIITCLLDYHLHYLSHLLLKKFNLSA